MKLLLLGHWSHTGFGVVTEQIGGRLAELGVDVRVLALNHRGEPIKGPLAGRVWPLQVLEQYYPYAVANAIDGRLWVTLDPNDEWKPDAVLAVADMSGLLNYIGDAAKTFETWKSVPTYHYCPIEGDNLPPFWAGVWAVVQPVAMSDYGARVIGDFIGRPVPRIYHGVDTERFYPVSPGKPIRWDGGVMREKSECKQKFGLDPRRKLILRADRNVVRKNFHALMAAFGLIAQADPDVDLLLHCKPLDPEGTDLLQEILRLPEGIRNRIKFTGMHDTWKGLPVEGLNCLYNAADVYMSTTGGEGFGLTLAEAMSAGVPVVATGWAAEVEVIGDGGVLVPPLHDSYGQPVRDHSRFGMDWAVPDPKAFVEPVLGLLKSPGRRKTLGAAGRLHVQRSFSWDEAAAGFLDLLLPEPAEAAA